MKRISKRLIASGALEVVATAVPGMKDILVLGKVKSLDELRAADLIIVDAPAAGHAISFLLSPRGLLDAVRVGPINKQAADVVSLLTDPDRCQVMLVTLPEETPVSEVIETAFAVEDRAGVALGPVIVNQCFEPLPDGVTDSVDDVLADAEACGRFVSQREADDLAHAVAFRADRHALQREQIERLGDRLPLPRIELPFLFTPDIGPAQVGTLADALTRGIEVL
jgi:anion-transporting  ArsA/GET3 family ATPase